MPSQTLKHRIEDDILSWLVDEGSLTKRLKQHCPENFSVDVLGMEWVKPDKSEASLLGIPATQKVLLRQVHLKCGDDLCVYARSVIPLQTLSGPHRCLRNLGDKPLGEYLFASPSLVRSRIEWAQLTPSSHVYRTALPQQQEGGDNIWGRRPLFFIDKRPLLVSEFFLPVLFATSPQRN